MPMIDLTLPRDALSDDAKKELMANLSRTLLKWEGAEPGNKAAESIAWTFVHEADLVTVAHVPAEEPRYRVVVGVPEGTVDEEAKAGLVAEVTEQVVRADRGDREATPLDATRVWVIVTEIIDGTWGGAGRIFRLPEIMAFAGASQDEIDRRSARLRAPAAV
jgi:phenylpyruvate tautomerase PptA (4-oxalocrotonate tautomerase family)